MTNSSPSSDQRDVELWGGLECTVARIGDDFRDQSLDTGHFERLDDLDRIASLGIRTLRYPALWETISPETPDQADWRWHDERFARLRELGIRPIVTLCHHGSGPRYTNLLDPAFPEKLARHAAAVAARYPWIDLYTPVNEPLTTARFSGLYGHWYPHETDYAAFLRALVHECKATVLAMRAIRAVRADAGLVQTEDFGKTFSTPMLAYQAEHDNERRWLSFDLLCGRMNRHHPLWGFLTHWAGFSEQELAFFDPADAAPDVLGINHYLTSDRFLDQRLRLYPQGHWGGNGRHRFADAEAVRVNLPGAEIGPAARLREVWERYKRPVAVTEVHHGCTRDEQLRWLMDVWSAAKAVRAEGADIRAVAVWSLFGTVDWNTLLTQRNGIYEPGVFDVRGPEPRATALASASAALASKGDFDHPVLDEAGWWGRHSRFYAHVRKTQPCRSVGSPRQLVVTGADGALGQAFSRLCQHRGLHHLLLQPDEIDFSDAASIEAALACTKPWAVIDAAGSVSGGDAHERQAVRARTLAAKNWAEICARLSIPLVSFSSDRVFDGKLGRAYVESDPVKPTSASGRRQTQIERLVLSACPQALVVRSGPLFGPWDRRSDLCALLQALASGAVVEASGNVVSPAYLPDLVHVVLDLLIDGETGLRHIFNPGDTSAHALARSVAQRAGFDPARVALARGPMRNTALETERGALMPPLDSAIERFVRDCEIDWSADPRYAVAAE